MTKREEQRMKGTGLVQLDQSLVSGKVRYLALLILLAMALPSLASASACGTLPPGLSYTIQSCIPVNIINTQNLVATFNGFQIPFNGLPFNAWRQTS